MLGFKKRGKHRPENVVALAPEPATQPTPPGVLGEPSRIIDVVGHANEVSLSGAATMHRPPREVLSPRIEVAPVTSTPVHGSGIPKPGTQKYKVLECFAISPMGLTDVALTHYPYLAGISLNALRPRRIELVRAGYLKDSGDRISTSTHAESIVWVITEKGRAVFDG